jgi:pyruvate formate lyase activating enzyme
MGICEQETGIVFNIQQFSVHDGPGIRTIVFLKGCPLRCQWCCNPESQDPQPELALNVEKCIGTGECGLCLRCSQKAIKVDAKGRAAIDRSLCTNCGACAEECPSKALELIGSKMSVREVLQAVEKDFCFYSRSGGGLTLSGGEPLFQQDFSIRLLKGAKAIGMDTAVETCGHIHWAVLEQACAFINTLLFDIKCMDSVKHKGFTGVSNALILENFKRACNLFPHIPKIVRTPVVPGFNDNALEIQSIAKFLRPFPNVTHELLPYHRFGEPKYTFMGKSSLLAEVKPPESTRMKELKRFAG